MKKIALFLMAALVLFVACESNEQQSGSIESLTLTPSSMELKVGTEKKIRVSVSPVTDEVYTVNWTSSNPEVASVDSKGTVVALAAGSATITASIEGTDISATASVTVVSPFDAIKFYTMSLMGMNENFYQIEGIDNNEDGKNDTIYEVTFYVLPESMYLQEKTLVGDDDYLLVLNTAIAVCYDAELGGNVAYSLGGYSFFENEEDYAVEVDGKKRMIPHTASYTHFNEQLYLDIYTQFMSNSEFDADAYIAEHGYWMGDFDSYVSYVNFEQQSMGHGGYLIGGAGLECGSKLTYELDFYEFELSFVEKPYALGFATEMVEDPETGEQVEQFVWPLEMAEMVTKTYTAGTPSQPTEEVQQRVSQQTVPFKVMQKQLSVNRTLFTSLKVAFEK